MGFVDVKALRPNTRLAYVLDNFETFSSSLA